MRLFSIVIFIAVLILGISFALLNSKPVLVNYYIGSKTLPLSVLLVGVFILGVVLGLFVSFPTILRLKLQLRRRLKGG